MRGDRSVVVGVAGLVALACEATSPQFVALPPLPDAQSIVLISPVDRTAWASPIDAPLRVESPPAGSELALLAYVESLEELGLDDGAVALDQACRPCAILSPRLIFQTKIVEENPPEWTEVFSIPPLVARIVPDAEDRCQPCRRFETVRVAELPTTADVVGLFSVEDLVVAFTADGGVVRLNEDSTPEPLCIPGQGGFRCAVRTGERTFWLSDLVDRWRSLDLDDLDPARSCIARTTTQSAGLRRALATCSAPLEDPPSEIFAMTRDSEAWVWRPNAGWTVLGTFSADDNDREILRLGPGLAIASNGGPALMRIRGDEVDIADFVIDGVGHNPTMLQWIEPFGLTLGSSDESIFLGDEDLEFRPFTAAARTGLRIGKPREAVEWNGGLLLTVGAASLGLVYPELGYCEPQVVLDTIDVEHLIKLADGTIVAGARNIQFLRPTSCAP